MMPAAPLVGAVTTRPPAAFSSLTAIAYRLTWCSASCGRSLRVFRIPASTARHSVGGAAFYIQAARQLAGRDETVGDAVAHHLPDLSRPASSRLRRHASALVGAQHGGNGQPCCFPVHAATRPSYRTGTARQPAAGRSAACDSPAAWMKPPPIE